MFLDDAAWQSRQIQSRSPIGRVFNPKTSPMCFWVNEIIIPFRIHNRVIPELLYSRTHATTRLARSSMRSGRSPPRNSFPALLTTWPPTTKNNFAKQVHKTNTPGFQYFSTHMYTCEWQNRTALQTQTMVHKYNTSKLAWKYAQTHMLGFHRKELEAVILAVSANNDSPPAFTRR